jgi:5-methylcytosine-specific restriction endonuclease McrA
MSMPSKADIFEYWKDWLDERCFDWGESDCWACRRWWDTKYDIKNSNVTWQEIRNVWNKVPLQRCHIIPKSLGGKDEPSNLFLMCKECHDLAPNTTSRKAFFEWVNSQNWMDRLIKKINDEFKNYGFDISDSKEMENLSKILLSKEFKEWAKENISIHFSQSGYGSRITFSSIVALLWDYIKK